MSEKNLLIRGWEVVIGLETHAQLATKSKQFSGSSTAFGAAPNTHANYVDMALPGTLPVANKQAVEFAITFGLALGSKIAPVSIYERKNYFYPDLPKGYQISQLQIPIVQGGSLSFMVNGEEKTVTLDRAHLEEDAGKSVHGEFAGMTGIDLNRGGMPLLEIVTRPDMRSTAEAVEYARALHNLVMWLGICDGNMQEGSFRCDANVSVRRPGEPFGTRREIKNLNSFRNMQQAIDYEINAQIDMLEDGITFKQATVLFDPDTGETRPMRTKEDSADYRYFPDPDLPPLAVSADWIERVRSTMPELPMHMAERFMQVYELSKYDASIMTQSKGFANYFEAAAKTCKQPKLVANWVQGEVARRLNMEEKTIEQTPVTATTLAALIMRISDGTISNNAAKQVFEALWTGQDSDVDQIIEAKGLKQMNDTGALEAIIDEIIATQTKSVEEYRAGKDKAFNALVGQVMKASKGRANPAQVNELMKKKLDA